MTVAVIGNGKARDSAGDLQAGKTKLLVRSRK